MKNKLKKISNEEEKNQKRHGAKRIPDFLSRLDNATERGNKSGYTPPEIAQYRKVVNTLCKAEIAYLRKQLSDNDGHYSVQTLHRYVSDYRNAVRDAFAGVEMPDMYGDRLGRKLKTHIAIKYLSMTRAEKGARKARDTEAKDEYMDMDMDTATSGRLVIANPENLIITAISLLQSKEAAEITIGLLAVTGRRPIEILHTATFTATHANRCLFTGQAKTRESEHARNEFEIFTLAPAKLIIDAMARLRKMQNFNGLTHRQIESRTSGVLGVTVRKHMSKVLEIEGLITPKSLRGIWVNIAHHLFKPSVIDTVFATNQLGHVASKGRKSSGAAENYMQYYAPPFATEKISEILTIIS